MAREFTIYCDESVQDGPYYARFYGGALVKTSDRPYVEGRLRSKMRALGLDAEVKWQKVSAGYLDRYIALMDEFFDLIGDGYVKVRIMFTKTAHVPTNLTAYHRGHAYHILYYQFLKHAFGLFETSFQDGVRIRVYLDRLPDKAEKNRLFKAHLESLENTAGFRRAGVRVPRDQIAEVDSHDHEILQCLDVVLGSMQFRLNDKHKHMPPGASQRGARTLAKEKLYKHINRRIRRIYRNFNVGVSTGLRGDSSNRWKDPYRHWLFQPTEFEFDPQRNKPRTR
jgi:hypothetical protein